MKPVEHYIPHQPPMRLIDRVLAATPELAITEALVTQDNIFYDAHLAGLPAWVGLEYLAQTAAVWLGAECDRQGDPVEPAFLISSREYTVRQAVWPLGEQIQIQVRPEWLDRPLVSFAGEVTDSSGKPLVEAVFAAYQPENFEHYLSTNTPDCTT